MNDVVLPIFSLELLSNSDFVILYQACLIQVKVIFTVE